jgi:hypothetical protein
VVGVGGWWVGGTGGRGEGGKCVGGGGLEERPRLGMHGLRGARSKASLVHPAEGPVIKQAPLGGLLCWQRQGADPHGAVVAEVVSPGSDWHERPSV